MTSDDRSGDPSSGNPLRWLYDWVLSWAHTPHGALALFVLAFTEATFFPVPPDVLLVALVLGARSKAFRLAAICTAGSVLGAISGFGIGYFLWSSVRWFCFQYLFEPSTFHYVSQLYEGNLFVIVGAAAISPIPFKVFTIASGVFGSDFSGGRMAGFFLQFLFASVVGRGVRFFGVAFLLYRYGRPMKDWIERYFDTITILLVLLLVLAVLLFRLF
jgi:membrane protein YqaA with SNARE-associated domain